MGLALIIFRLVNAVCFRGEVEDKKGELFHLSTHRVVCTPSPSLIFLTAFSEGV